MKPSGTAADLRTLQDAALACLLADTVDEKLERSAFAAECDLPLASAVEAVISLPEIGRPAAPRLVAPRELAQRGLGTEQGRAAFVHAIAHIEFNAINLAWDAVCRFRDMPDAFYQDWVSVASDEARHFQLLRARLASLGHAYGDFDAHNGLWEMAVATEHSCLERMALVPRVLEARGLDVTPMMIDRLRSAGDLETADILAIILREEVAHVAVGSRWFVYCCERDGLIAEPTFERLVSQHARGAVRGPFNRPHRLKAGFSESELQTLDRISKSTGALRPVETGSARHGTIRST